MEYAVFGERGVELFYIVSAFTLFLARDTHRGRERYPTSNFFIRRFFRIAPLYYSVIALNLAIHGLRPRADAPLGLSWFDIFTALTFVNAWKPLAFNSVAIGGWSVAIESMFYFMLPTLYKRIRGLPDAAILLAVSLPACSLITRFANSRSILYRPYFVNWFPVHFPIFVMGIVGYFLWTSCKSDTGTSRSRRALSLVLLTASLVLVLGCIPATGANLYSSSFASLAFVLGCGLHTWPPLINRATCFLGRISFSIYLLHFLP